MEIPQPRFADDSGTADPALRAALAQTEAGGLDDHYEALRLLQAARLLVPVVAILDELDESQPLAREKASSMATALITGADGRLALPAFTGVDALAAWDPLARPMPVTTPEAARSACDLGAAALIIDLAGPHRFVIETRPLQALADGWTVVRRSGAEGQPWLWVQSGHDSGSSG